MESLRADTKRRQAIVHLLQNKALKSQQEVVSCLQEQGFKTTQSSVSRDLDYLQVVKVQGTYRLLNGTVSGYDLQPCGDNLVVLKTQQGGADSYALKIDSLNVAGVIGTVSGDDTMLIACNLPPRQVIAELKKIL